MSNLVYSFVNSDTINIFKDYVMPILNSLIVLIIVFVANKLNNKADAEDIIELKKELQTTNAKIENISTTINSHISKTDVEKIIDSVMAVASENNKRNNQDNQDKRIPSEIEKQLFSLLVDLKQEMKECKLQIKEINHLNKED